MWNPWTQNPNEATVYIERMTYQMGLKEGILWKLCPFPLCNSISPSATVLKLVISMSSLTFADVADEACCSDTLLRHSQ